MEEASYSPFAAVVNVSVFVVRLLLSPACAVADCRIPKEKSQVARELVVVLVDLVETWRCRSTRTADDRLDDYP